MPDDPKEKFAGAKPKFFTIAQAAGINTQAQREAIKDEQFSWLENLQPIGDGNYRALYSNGSSIYTAPGGVTIIYAYFFNVAATQYAAVFLVRRHSGRRQCHDASHYIDLQQPGELLPGLGNTRQSAAGLRPIRQFRHHHRLHGVQQRLFCLGRHHAL